MKPNTEVTKHGDNPNVVFPAPVAQKPAAQETGSRSESLTAGGVGVQVNPTVNPAVGSSKNKSGKKMGKK